ncbi:MAG: hypothetical protein IJ058_12760 [Lachnospiraceae bacterium]|nr:hypothetical protein [Lachnospiraceae bacterium]
MIKVQIDECTGRVQSRYDNAVLYAFPGQDHGFDETFADVVAGVCATAILSKTPMIAVTIVNELSNCTLPRHNCHKFKHYGSPYGNY